MGKLLPKIEACSWGPRIELFARGQRRGWFVWGDQAEAYTPTWNTYPNHSQEKSVALEKEISVEDMQKIVDANEKLVKELENNEHCKF